MDGKLVVKMRRNINVIPLDSIMYLENRKRKIVVHTPDGIYEEYGSLTEIIKALDDSFLHCHRSYLLNMESIASMSNQQITFCDGSTIFMGRGTFLRTRRKVEEYLEGKNEKSIENP
ncbi:MAG: LytTR family DNA-binding domain-containing protein [Bacillota bacterium]|nr:LytTR family DNA-binding domain-containing protein [Bacillota bacterium]